MNPLVIMALMQGAQMAMNYFGGGDQDHESFFTSPDEARANMADVDAKMTDYGQALTDYAKRPVQLRSAYAQAPPHYSGGGMPMPLGLTGRDPALDDKSLLSLPGLQFPANFFSGGPSNPGGSGNPPPGGGLPPDAVPLPPGAGAPAGKVSTPGYRTYGGYDPSGGGQYGDPQADEIVSWLKLAGGGGKP